MRWLWAILWIVLSVIQLVILLAGPLWHPDPILLGSGLNEDLVDLARRTNRQWDQLFQNMNRDAPETTEKEVLTIEAWMLRLSETQQKITRRGIEPGLVDQLQRWLLTSTRTPSKSVSPANVNDYLAGVMSWLYPFLSGDPPVLLRKVSLEPGARSDYPDMYFEMGGDPASMGQSLWKAASRSGSWQVGHLQFVRGDGRDDWWLMGNCAYEPKTEG